MVEDKLPLELPPETKREEARWQLRGLPAWLESLGISFWAWLVVGGLSVWFCVWLVRALSRMAGRISQ